MEDIKQPKIVQIIPGSECVIGLDNKSRLWEWNPYAARWKPYAHKWDAYKQE